MAVIWNCLYCGRELLREDSLGMDGNALDIAVSVHAKLDTLSTNCECEVKELRLYTYWFKDGKNLSRQEYFKFAKRAGKESKSTPEYLTELGYKHGIITDEIRQISERQRKIRKEVKITRWQKDGHRLDKRVYEKLAKRARKQGIGAAKYLKSLGYSKYDSI